MKCSLCENSANTPDGITYIRGKSADKFESIPVCLWCFYQGEISEVQIELIAYHEKLAKQHGSFINAAFHLWKTADPANQKLILPMMKEIIRKYPEVLVLARTDLK